MVNYRVISDVESLRREFESIRHFMENDNSKIGILWGTPEAIDCYEREMKSSGH